MLKFRDIMLRVEPLLAEVLHDLSPSALARYCSFIFFFSLSLTPTPTHQTVHPPKHTHTCTPTHAHPHMHTHTCTPTLM